MTTPITRLIEHYGNVSATARAFGKSRQEVQQWKKKGFIPFKLGQRVQELTEGKITALEVFEAAGKNA